MPLVNLDSASIIYVYFFRNNVVISYTAGQTALFFINNSVFFVKGNVAVCG